ncbi:hypothetical protein CsatA_002010 [Cannabis sativa]
MTIDGPPPPPPPFLLVRQPVRFQLSWSAIVLHAPTPPIEFNVSITGGVWFEEEGGKNRGSCKKKMVGSGSKVVESDKEKKNKNVSISKRSGVSEASFDDRRSKKLKSVVEDFDDFDSKCDEAPIMLPKKKN